MKSVVYILPIFAMSFAADVSIYNYFDFYENSGIDPEPQSFSAFPWKLGFYKGEHLNMEIHYSNNSSDITAISVEVTLNGKGAPETIEVPMINNMFSLNHSLSAFEVNIQVQLYKSNNRCAPRTVINTRQLSPSSSIDTKTKYKRNDICLKLLKKPCVIMVDLKKVECVVLNDIRTSQKPEIKTTPIPRAPSLPLRAPPPSRASPPPRASSPPLTSTPPAPPPTRASFPPRTSTSPAPPPTRASSQPHASSSPPSPLPTPTTPVTTSQNYTVTLQQRITEKLPLKNATGSTNQQPLSRKSVLIYVVPSVVVLCVIVLAIFICVKKYRHRKLHAEGGMEVNTYVTRNEVVYADLSLLHSDRPPPTHDEESPYARIIGVMRPVDEIKQKK